MPHSLSGISASQTKMQSMQHPRAKRNLILQRQSSPPLHRQLCWPKPNWQHHAALSWPAWPQLKLTSSVHRQGQRDSKWSSVPLDAGAKDWTHPLMLAQWLMLATFFQMRAAQLQHRFVLIIARIQDSIQEYSFFVSLNFSYSFCFRFPLLLQVWIQWTPTTK